VQGARAVFEIAVELPMGKRLGRRGLLRGSRFALGKNRGANRFFDGSKLFAKLLASTG
jgi:hypothetical protein